MREAVAALPLRVADDVAIAVIAAALAEAALTEFRSSAHGDARRTRQGAEVSSLDVERAQE